jgi:hypothetical protein
VADLSPPPALSELLQAAPVCGCQPAKTPFVAVPALGTHLVHNGAAAALTAPDMEVPAADFVTQTIRGMYDYAARTLADAPPGTQLQVRLTVDGRADASVLGSYIFERAPQEADRG